MNNLGITCILLCLGAGLLKSEVINRVDGETINSALPKPVLLLSRLLDSESTSQAEVVDPNGSIVAVARNQSWDWITRVLNPSWQPRAKTEMLFFADQVDGRDTTRVEWAHDDYRLKVVQTRSIFVLEIEATRSGPMESDNNLQYEIAQRLCREVFNPTGRMWARNEHGLPHPVTIAKLNEKIAEFSFERANTKELPDKTVVGNARSMKQAGIDSNLGHQAVPRGVEPNENMPEAWHYWFRNVNWWKNGRSIGFYFLKTEGLGAWRASFLGNVDKAWFSLAHTRIDPPK